MSQRPPKKNRSTKSNTRKTRTQSTPRTKTAPQAQPQSARTKAAADATAQEGARPSERRQSRRDAAIRKEQQKKQLRLIIGGVIAAAIVATVLILLNRPTNDAADIDYEGLAVAPPPIAAAAGTPPAGEEAASYQGAVLGDPNAPVTFAIYADFQCSFCVQFHQDTYPQIIEDFVRDGEVKIEFREFPALGDVELTNDENESVQAAEAAVCAGEQDRYIEYHDKLYANFNGVNQGAYNTDRLKDYASDLDLDTAAFNECLDTGRYEASVIQSMEEGRATGITATPMFIIDNGNGQPNVVQQTSAGYDLLKRQIEVAIETTP